MTLNDPQTKPEFMPDFFTIPWQVWTDKNITPLGAKVFAVVYWYERMKDGYCHANNATIARIVGSGNTVSISNALKVLVERGYLDATYDGITGNRTALSTLIAYGETPSLFNDAPSSNDDAPHHQMMNDNKNIKKEHSIMSDSEKLDIEKLYRGWLIEMVIGFAVWQGFQDDPQARRDYLVTARKKVRLTEKRRQKMLSRLRELGMADCIKAIKNVANASDFYRGNNDNKWKATIEWLFNSTEKTEEWANK